MESLNTFTQGPTQIDFSYRAKQLKTYKQQKQLNQQQLQFMALTQGMPKETYWQQKVRTKEDAVLYFQLYHPEYPEVLARAIAERFEMLLNKYANGEKLTETELNMLKNEKEESHWDPEKEIEAQKLEGKIQLTNKRLEDLLAGE